MCLLLLELEVLEVVLEVGWVLVGRWLELRCGDRGR